LIGALVIAYWNAPVFLFLESFQMKKKQTLVAVDFVRARLYFVFSFCCLLNLFVFFFLSRINSY